MQTTERASDHLVAALSRHGLDEGHVRELVDVVGQMGELKRAKGFPLGTIDPDGIMIKTIIDREQLKGLFELLATSPRLDAVRLFPRGIIDPEVFQVELELR